MKRSLLTFSLLALSSCFATLPVIRTTLRPPFISTGYPGKVGVVCSLFGEAEEVTLGAYNSDFKHHGTFAPNPDLRKLLNVPERSVNFVNPPTLDECFAQAEDLVKSELPSTWSIVKTEAIAGHCWRAEGWRPCVAGAEPFDSYAFPLHKGAPKHLQWFAPIDYGDNKEKKIDMYFYVIVHPQ